MRTTVATSLDERQVIGILDRAGELADFGGEKVGVVGDFDFGWNLVFGFLGGVNDVWLVLDQAPFEALLRSVDIKTFAILPSRIEKESPDVSRDVGILDLDMTRFDGESITRFRG